MIISTITIFDKTILSLWTSYLLSLLEKMCFVSQDPK